MCFFINRTAVAGAPFGGKAPSHIVPRETNVHHCVTLRDTPSVVFCATQPIALNACNDMCLRILFCSTHTNMST